MDAVTDNPAVKLIRTAGGIAVGLIAAIFTVELAIAVHGSPDASPVGALKLIGEATSMFAALLVRSVPAVVVEVTLPVAGQAAAVGAAEVVRVAAHGLLVARRALVLPARAVVVPVTAPRQGDAAPRGAAERAGGALTIRAVGRLIRSVKAVIISVTCPHLGDAAAVIALKLIRWTDLGWAIQFVFPSTSAVDVAITP